MAGGRKKAGGRAGSESRKVTLVLPRDLVTKATEATGLGLTPTVKQGLRLVAAGRAFVGLRALRGKVKFSLDLKALRED
jgi:hypothetical protein